MNPVRRQRLLIVLGALTGVALAAGLLLYAISDNINLFYTPQQVVNGEAPVGQRMRVGGLVTAGSVRRDQESLKVQFDLTDGIGTFTVYYQGILPDLFREGQGIVANGTLTSRESFEATEVLAKHDETYMPPEVQDALERAGHPGAAGKNADAGEGKAGASYY
ncbi:cytochrome c-type biogenesis protein CcmE [Isoalcanivorax pacificus W11-5]|uniref:Cytochrome c-type biogenesis protein CcmE n=1 Tax=Isoalcanivorax pacificus W11-5 TaxID=391936 RepID=A0A0B4XNB6_9GAMM|nr:cytochrome c maturation protein CcmE [Isoalcanivorax pacificus]AJD47802.1 cytochrome c-type biogenesis protein CcmE [Isoalcanivorax pacificus W11-5]